MGKEAIDIILPYVDGVFSTVDCKTDEIRITDNLQNKELDMKFDAIKVLPISLKLRLTVSITFSNLGSAYRKPMELIINMSNSVVPILPFQLLQRVYRVSNKFGGSEFFSTYYNIGEKIESYDTQMKRIVKDYNDNFKRAIEVYTKTFDFMLSEENPPDLELIAELPDVKDIFIF